MKHKLKLEDLAVDTFRVAAEAAGGRGTVRAFGKPLPQPGHTAGEYTCLEDACHLSFEQTCGECPVLLLTVNELTCLVDVCQPTFVYSCGGDPELCGIEP